MTVIIVCVCVCVCVNVYSEVREVLRGISRYFRGTSVTMRAVHRLTPFGRLCINCKEKEKNVDYFRSPGLKRTEVCVDSLFVIRSSLLRD